MICIYISLCLPLSLYVYIYIYTYARTYIYIYIYIHMCYIQLYYNLSYHSIAIIILCSGAERAGTNIGRNIRRISFQGLGQYLG